MAYQDLRPVVHGATQEQALENIKKILNVDAEHLNAYRGVHPAFIGLGEQEGQLVIFGTVDKSLHMMYRELGKDTSNIEFYVEIEGGERVYANDANRVLNSRDTRKFEKGLRPSVEKALDEYMKGQPIEFKSRVKEAILRNACRQVTRILLNKTLNSVNIKSAVLKMERK